MAGISHKKIGEILVENGLINETQLAEALAEQRAYRQRENHDFVFFASVVE